VLEGDRLTGGRNDRMAKWRNGGPTRRMGSGKRKKWHGNTFGNGEQ